MKRTTYEAILYMAIGALIALGLTIAGLMILAAFGTFSPYSAPHV